MSDDTADSVLYPNRRGDGGAGGSDGVSRRTLLAGSAAAGAAATAGCSGSTPGSGGSGDDEQGPPTVYVFNTGDMTVSVIDAAADELVTTTFLGATASFPSNQFLPGMLTGDDDAMWLNVEQGVQAVTAGSLSEAASLDTGSGANWQEVTPDGEHLIVSAREPTHKQYRLDADPASDSFGEVTAELDRTDEGGRGDNNGPGPCDISIHPDGQYAYVPDIFADTLTVLDYESFEIVNQVSVDPVGDADNVSPWMDTVAWDGETLLVENNEGDNGTESIWDISDPTEPEEVARLTADDNLGALPLTSEIGPDSETAYVFTANSEDVTVIDLTAPEVIDRIDLGGSAFVGTWDPAREKLYVPVQTSDEVKVIDHAAGEIVETIAVGSKPYGATAGFVRPETDASSNLLASLATLGVEIPGGGTTYCIGECACGHQL
jgi:DNA-binding beta-propeller fold protein YncE